jgi:opacity protein-like surface antigen
MIASIRLALAILACALALPAAAQQAAGVFAKGRTHVFVTGGAGYAFDESYFVLGAGLTYYPIDGLGLGLSFESWTGADPGVTKLTPSVQYVFYQLGSIKPYLGGFYRRTYIDGLPDLDSIGARAGIYLRTGSSAYLGLGAVYESYQDCSASTYRKCESTYPEVSFTIAF